MKIRLPDEIKIFTAVDGGHSFAGGERICMDDVCLKLNVKNDRLTVSVSAEITPLFHLRLRWNFTSDEKRRGVRVLGDTWERSYGELEWRSIVPHRFMPWYILVSNGSDLDMNYDKRLTEGFGVAVRPAAVCAWQYDTCGVNLWMDIRCGGDGVLLCGRELEVCDVLMRDYKDMSAYAAGRAFCAEMCTDPLIPANKVYGSNNWYYAVGDSSHGQILRDAELVSSLAEGLEERPYMVIDDGWQINGCDGPWEVGGELFPDMARLAREITERGAKPGIWVRFLSDSEHMSGMDDDMYIPSRPEVLDPSLPEVIEYVKSTVRRITGWGYKLIKHDFTTYDIFGVYGHARGVYLAENGWSFRDRGRTSAEITTHLYRAILEAADDDTVIIACNTPSHLTAGLAHLMRTGFDTSGRYFERTRICGVNTLAFRMMQNGTFYMIDADCCSHTGRIDWRLNSEWLRLLGESGTPLFISADPDKTGDEQKRDIRAAFEKNSRQTDEMIPLDWMENETPEVYLVNGEEKTYRWYTEEGTHQFIPPTDQEY